MTPRQATIASRVTHIIRNTEYVGLIRRVEGNVMVRSSEKMTIKSSETRQSLKRVMKMRRLHGEAGKKLW